jgi:hypothetical protein
MTSDGYPPSGSDPPKNNAKACWAVLPTVIFPPLASDRPGRREERRATQDWRDERLARAAYLFIVGTERAVRTVASFISRVGRSVARQVSPRDASTHPRASRQRP